MSRWVRSVLAICTAPAIVAANAGAARAGELTAAVSITPGAVVFEATVPLAGYTLLVGCAGGDSFQQEFGATETPVFTPLREDGEPMADGVCRYDLFGHPQLERVKAAKTDGDEAVMKELLLDDQKLLATGSFSIENGGVVPPEASVGEGDAAGHDSKRAAGDRP